MHSDQIRQKFLDFFLKKEHKLVKGTTIINRLDPDLLFVNSGMNQFKNIFLGNEQPPCSRAVNSQPCLRVTGKHNDLEEVGLDTYHLTFFEMLGNWSFNDAFGKKEAIAYAWELITQVYKLPPSCLYATIFSGDQTLPKDQEAADYWSDYLPKEQILPGSKEDNFWEMGSQGPCGPCSELHIDLRSEQQRSQVAGSQLVNQGHPEVIELWNLVFMQYNRLATGRLQPLHKLHIDTGLGLERLVMALQKKRSLYATDLFQPIISQIEQLTQQPYLPLAPQAVAHRVIADHIRAITFSIADGGIPSTQKEGYVIRRILRRAIRYGYTHLNCQEPFLYKLVSSVIQTLKSAYPHLLAQSSLVEKIIFKEEKSFFSVIQKGIKRLDRALSQPSVQTQKLLDGEIAFELYDTYGFPYDLTQLMAREHGVRVEEKGFMLAMNRQKEKSNKDAEQQLSDWIIVHEGEKTDFVGYDSLTATTKLLKYRVGKSANGSFYELVFAQTPFYPEGGGQVGDTGFLLSNTNQEQIFIWNTQKKNNLVIHSTDKLPTQLESPFFLQVDAERREGATSNHTATHLLYQALKEVLGSGIEQKGSLVQPQSLRFDFTYSGKIEKEALTKIEKIVNEKIRENLPQKEEREVPKLTIEQRGIKTLFGEKYGDKVRVISFGSYSQELCGGTHVAATGAIGFFKILHEKGIASGIRRINAITGKQAHEYILEQLGHLQEVRRALHNPKSVLLSIQELNKRCADLQKELNSYEQDALQKLFKKLVLSIEKQPQRDPILEQVEATHPDQLRSLAFRLQKKYPDKIIFLATYIKNSTYLLSIVPVSHQPAYSAQKMIACALPFIKGKGGGNSSLAFAKGEKKEGITQLLEQLKKQF